MEKKGKKRCNMLVALCECLDLLENKGSGWDELRGGGIERAKG